MDGEHLEAEHMGVWDMVLKPIWTSYLFMLSRKSPGGKGNQQTETTAVIYVPEIILSEADSSNVELKGTSEVP